MYLTLAHEKSSTRLGLAGTQETLCGRPQNICVLPYATPTRGARDRYPEYVYMYVSSYTDAYTLLYIDTPVYSYIYIFGREK